MNERLNEIRQWVSELPTARVVAVLPCQSGEGGKASSVCKGNNPTWPYIVRFVQQADAFAGQPRWIIFDSQAGVLFPDDEVKPREEWDKPPTKGIVSLIQRELTEELHDAAFLTFLPDRLKLQSALQGRHVLHAFQGLDEQEQLALAKKLSGTLLSRPSRSAPNPLPPGMLVLSAEPRIAGGKKVAVLYVVTGVDGTNVTIAPWPRTVWPAPSVSVEPHSLIPLPLSRPVVTDRDLHRMYEERQQAMQKRAESSQHEATAKQLRRDAEHGFLHYIEKRREDGPQEPFGLRDIEAVERLQDLPLMGVNTDEYPRTVIEIARGQKVPKAVVVPMLRRVYGDDVEALWDEARPMLSGHSSSSSPLR